MSTAEILSRRALSREGHAAMSMKGGSDKWIYIQKTTFTNWVNEQLREGGDLVEDLQTDLCDGIRLCRLVEHLQERKVGRIIKKPINQHQFLENVQLALNAIADDNIRLVNIGSEDIVNGNLKLILGLVWHLILRYQIGKTKFPPKKLMLAWLRAVIPERQISNFTSDWNDGVLLHALIDYCKPGVFPNWRNLSSLDRLDNCQHAMTVAKEEFGIPLVLRPEDLSSPDLDDLSGMTYLSYYMKSESPGYYATLNNVRQILRHGTVNNFTTDWNDGRVLANLCKSLGQNVELTNDPVENLERGIEAGRNLGVEPILPAEEIATAEEEHLGIMAYAAYFTRLQPTTAPSGDRVKMDCDMSNVYVGREKNFSIMADESVSTNDVRAEVIGPDSLPPVYIDWYGKKGNASFTPTEPGNHKLNVYCESQVISQCPVNFRVSSDRNKVSFARIDLLAAGQMTELKVDTAGAGQGDVRLEARSPSDRTQSLNAVYRNGTYSANFTPDEVGEWTIGVMYEGEHIQGSPYPINVFDPAKVRIYGLEGGTVGRELSFNADCKQSGDGDLRVDIFNGGGSVPCRVIKEGYCAYRCDFTPRGAGDYKIHAYLNEQEIRGSPFNCEIVDSSMVTASGDGLSLVPVNRTTFFDVHTQGAGGQNVQVEVTGPDGEFIPCRMKNTGENKITVDYMPTDPGTHRVSVKHGEKEMEGSPFSVRAYDISAIDITSLPNGIVGDPINFIIDVSRAGDGQLEIMVNRGDLQNEVEALRTGVYRITFVPVIPGEQRVEIRFNEESIEGSPFTCNAIDLGGAQMIGFEKTVLVNQHSCFTIHSEADGTSDLRAVVDVISPSGEQVPATIIPQPDGDYKVDWTPSIPGTYTLDVTFAGRPIQGSPFYVNVFDANRVQMHDIYGGVIHEEAGLSFDAREAGSADYDVRVIGPSGHAVHHSVIERNDQRCITYTPVEVGRHTMHVTYGGVEVQGSPIIQEITEGTLPTAEGDGLVGGEEDHPASFIILSQGMRGKPSVTVDGPNSIAKVSCDAHHDGSYTVTYVPVEVGTFNIQVKWNDIHIPGSPFYSTVIDPRKVRIVGGWQHFMDGDRVVLDVDEEKQLPFDVSEAGPGKLTCEVKGPRTNPPVYIDIKAEGQTIVAFTPREEGEHFIYLFWNGHPLMNSPFIGYAASSLPDITKVILSGKGLREAAVRQKAEFLIDGTQAGPGAPDVRLAGVKADIPVNVTHLGSGKYRCTYLPVVPGAYLLHINWYNRQLRGSPYKVNVISACNPEKVVVLGEGLRGGILGKELDVVIDTKKAGPGELTAHCMGPHEVSYCALEDNGNGVYHLRIKPKEPGRHVLQIKYGGEHVLGSPYIIRISQHSDASKVRVSGPGVEHGILHNYQSRFIVETRGAGPGQLTVRIRGPKGAFNVEMHRESQKDRTILCRYSPHEIGLYYISVKWSGVDVPGSPFQCYIVDTQEDVERVLSDSAFGRLNTSFNSAPSSSNYNGYSNFNTWSRDDI